MKKAYEVAVILTADVVGCTIYDRAYAMYGKEKIVR